MKQYRKSDIVETDKVQSVAEDLFVQLFSEAFGLEFAGECILLPCNIIKSYLIRRLIFYLFDE